MGSAKFFVATLASVLAGAATFGTAKAADFLPPPPVAEPFEFASGGWYLRGDIGFSNQSVDRLTNTAAVPETITFQKGFDGAPFGGVGVGYKFNEWLRGDLTGEYRSRASFHGLDRYPDRFAASGTGFGTNEYTGSKSEWVGLANVYFDLGTWYGFTPFIGGGVGFAHNMIHDFKDTNVPNAGVAFARDASKSNLAWAVHAGVAYSVAPSVSVEFAYRYLNLGDAQSGVLLTYLGGLGAPPVRFRDLDSHDFKFGVRWALGDNGHYEPAPLIRKY